MLPILVPGLKVGKDVKVTEDKQLSSWSKMAASLFRTPNVSTEFGELPESKAKSPEMTKSTPGRPKRANTISGHKKNHFSLPRYVDMKR